MWFVLVFFLFLMDLSPRQLFCQDKILLSLYPWLSIQEARAREFWEWCKIIWRKNWYTTVISTVISARYDRIFTYIAPYNRRDYSPIRIQNKQIEQIIWLPPTLPRVLIVLWKGYFYYDGNIMYTDYADSCSDRVEWTERICFWDLINPYRTEATLRDQSEETQTAIALLLWYE